MAVENITEARKFYEGLLGQKVKYDFGRDVTFEGDFTIHLRSHFQELLGGASQYPVKTQTNNCELYFETEEIETYLERLEQAGVKFIHKVKEQPWGQRVLRCYDPDGHIVEIGEPMEVFVRRQHATGMTVEEIIKKTKLAESFVLSALGKS